MNELAVHFAPHHVDAEVAVSALRAYNLHPRMVRDDPMLSTAGGLSGGRFVVFVPEREAARARAVLREPIQKEREDNPVLRLVVIVAVIAGLLLTTPFVAGVCVGPP